MSKSIVDLEEGGLFRVCILCSLGAHTGFRGVEWVYPNKIQHDLSGELRAEFERWNRLRICHLNYKDAQGYQCMLTTLSDLDILTQMRYLT